MESCNVSDVESGRCPQIGGDEKVAPFWNSGDVNATIKEVVPVTGYKTELHLSGLDGVLKGVGNSNLQEMERQRRYGKKKPK